MTENNSPLERLLDWCAVQVASTRLSEKTPSTGEIDDDEVRQEIEQVEADMRAVERDHRSLVDAYGAAIQELQRLGAKSVPLTPSTARLRDLLGGYECPKCGGSGRIPVIDLGVGEVIDKVPCPVCRPDDTPRRDALEALDEIVPELEFGRGTHVQWREYLQQHPDGEKRNPECGDADFHAKMVEVYDKRLDAINKARRALTAPPTVPEAVRKVMDELGRAREKFPQWPDDPIHAATVVSEEAGELAQAALQSVYEPGKECSMHDEAVQTAAMAIRFLENIQQYEMPSTAQHDDRALTQTQSQQGGEAGRIPEGWKLVPDHSTVEWADNLEKIARKGGYDTVIDGVLAAAPEPDEGNDNGQ